MKLFLKILWAVVLLAIVLLAACPMADAATSTTSHASCTITWDSTNLWFNYSWSVGATFSGGNGKGGIRAYREIQGSGATSTAGTNYLSDTGVYPASASGHFAGPGAGGWVGFYAEDAVSGVFVEGPNWTWIQDPRSPVNAGTKNAVKVSKPQVVTNGFDRRGLKS